MRYKIDAASFLIQERRAVERMRRIIERAKADGWEVVGDEIIAPDVDNELKKGV